MKTITKTINPARSRYLTRVTAFKSDTTIAAPAKKIKTLSFIVPQFHALFGETLKCVGSIKELGEWDLCAAPTLNWSEGDRWTLNLTVSDSAAEGPVEFKLVYLRHDQPPLWEDTPNTFNRKLIINPDESSIQINCPFGYVDLMEKMTGDDVDVAATAAVSPLQDGDAAVQALVDQFASLSPAVVDEDLDEKEDEKMAVLIVVEEKQEKEKVDIQTAALTEDTAAAIAVKEKDPPVDTATKKKDKNFIKTFGKTAGYVALGVAGVAAASALAIDVTDVAVMGALVAAAGGGAAVKNGSKTRSVSKGEEEGEEERLIVKKRPSSADPAVALAAGVLTAFELGKSAVDSFSVHSIPSSSSSSSALSKKQAMNGGGEGSNSGHSSSEEEDFIAPNQFAHNPSSDNREGDEEGDVHKKHEGRV
jgi:hypothetical protein